MSDYKDVRMSDKEFIEGIYKKADERAESVCEDNVVSIKKKKEAIFQKAAKGVCLAAGCAVTLIASLRSFKPMHESKDSTIDNAMYRSVDDTEADEELVATPKETKPIRIQGVIERSMTDEDRDILVIEVQETKVSSLPKEVQVVISDEMQDELEYYMEERGLDCMSGFNVVLFLESYNWKEYYKVKSDADLYLQKTLDGNTVYENLFGDRLDQ